MFKKYHLVNNGHLTHFWHHHSMKNKTDLNYRMLHAVQILCSIISLKSC